MQDNIKHTTIKTIALLLLLAIAFPSAVKFNHVFENHKHEVCDAPLDSHFHEIEIDCEFYKFKINTPFTLTSNTINVLEVENNHNNTSSYYSFINSFTNLGIALRGPPSSKNNFS